MSKPPYKVLFLCTGNSARSIIAEALLNNIGKGNFRAFSAGSQPEGQVNPYAMKMLEKYRFPTSELRSKHGTSSPRRNRHASISSSRYATGPLARYARYGPDSR